MTGLGYRHQLLVNNQFPSSSLYSFQFSVSRLLASTADDGGRGRANQSLAWWTQQQPPQQQDVAAFTDYPNFSAAHFSSSQFLRELGHPSSRLDIVFEQWMYHSRGE